MSEITVCTGSERGKDTRVDPGRTEGLTYGSSGGGS